MLGSTGMAGHVITSRLMQITDIEVLNASTHRFDDNTILLDARDSGAVKDLIKEQHPDFIINCIGILINAAEKHKVDAIALNSLLPHILAESCDRFGGKVLHLSTDCVFSGRSGPYRINDYRDGDTHYDRTKTLGEILNDRDLTIRTSITGPELRKNGTGLFHWFMQQRGQVNGYVNALWSGVMTTELANFLEHVIMERPDLKGLIHFSVPEGISKFELLKLFVEEFDTGAELNAFDSEKIDKRLIPSSDLGFTVSSYRDQVRDVHRWILRHKEWYPFYFER